MATSNLHVAESDLDGSTMAGEHTPRRRKKHLTIVIKLGT
jgi:hypothetical protein